MTPSYVPVLGGREAHVFNIVGGLRDFDFEVLTARMPGVCADPSQGANVRVHRMRPAEYFYGPRALPTRVAPLVSLFDFLSVLRLVRQKRHAVTLGCDLVHTHWVDVDMMTSLERVLSASSWERLMDHITQAATFDQPTIFTDHSLFVRSRLSKALLRFLEHALREYDAVFCVEREGVDCAKAISERSGGSAQIVYVPNSVDTDLFAPVARDTSDVGTVAYVGRANKSHGLLLELVRLLPRHRFLLVVAGSDRMLQKWESLQSERVVLHRNVGPLDLPRVMSQADVVVNPLQVNGMSRVSLESLAMGIPVVTDAGESRFPVVDGKSGLVVPPSATDFSRAVGGLLANPKLRQSLGKEGRRLVLNEFSNSIVLPHLRELYLRLIG